jgi:hypothetical protein
VHPSGVDVKSDCRYTSLPPDVLTARRLIRTGYNCTLLSYSIPNLILKYYLVEHLTGVTILFV